MRRVAILLAGGGGSRLWPASTPTRPKQFLTLDGGASLLALTARRLTPLFPSCVVVAPEAHADAVAHNVPGAHLVLEPMARNTLGAVALGLAHVLASGEDAVVGIFPCDHLVADTAGFAQAVETSLVAAQSGDHIVTIGIEPTSAHTGYGYLELAAADARTRLQEHRQIPLEVAAFREKPDAQTARAYLFAGNTLWNSGMVFARASYLWHELHTHVAAGAASFAALLTWAATNGPHAGVSRAPVAAFEALPQTSLDYAVMEKTPHVLAVAGRFGWSDLGAWDAVGDTMSRDEAGNASRNSVALHNARGNVVYVDPGVQVAMVGCDNLVVALVDNRLLVASLAHAQDVGEVARRLAQWAPPAEPTKP